MLGDSGSDNGAASAGAVHVLLRGPSMKGYTVVPSTMGQKHYNWMVGDPDYPNCAALTVNSIEECEAACSLNKNIANCPTNR